MEQDSGKYRAFTITYICIVYNYFDIMITVFVTKTKEEVFT